MSKYTTELRQYIESFSHYNQNPFPISHNEKIEIGRKKLFDFDYPIFNENYRKDFETHFIRKFYMKEIAFETMGLFKFHLETWLNINMPYWNKMFESEILESQYNPLANSKMDVTHNKTNNVKQNGTSDLTGHNTSNGSRTNNATTGSDSTDTFTGNSFNRDLESDNPDSRLSITENSNGTGVIEYASKINENSGNESSSRTNHSGGTNSSTENDSQTSDNTVSQNSNSTVDDTENFIQHREGKIGVQTYAKMIQEHRQIFLRIENQIFNEMQELFMLIY
jgi:hypothetical protein